MGRLGRKPVRAYCPPEFKVPQAPAKSQGGWGTFLIHMENETPIAAEKLNKLERDGPRPLPAAGRVGGRRFRVTVNDTVALPVTEPRSPAGPGPGELVQARAVQAGSC